MELKFEIDDYERNVGRFKFESFKFWDATMCDRVNLLRSDLQQRLYLTTPLIYGKHQPMSFESVFLKRKSHLVINSSVAIVFTIIIVKADPTKARNFK